MTERAEYRFWDHWLTDGREPHVFVCDVAHRTVRGRAGGHRRRAAAVGPVAGALRHRARTAARSRITVDLGRRARHDEPARHRDRRPRARGRKRSLTARQRHVRRASALFAGRPLDRSRAYDTGARSTTRGTCALRRTRAAARRALAPALRPRDDARRNGRPIRARCCSWSRTAAASASTACRSDAALPALIAPGGTIARLRALAPTARAGLSRARRRRHPPALFAARGDGSAERAIESLNRALLARHAFGEMREFTIKGWHGEPVQMFVTYPPDFDPDEEVAADAFDPRRPARRAPRRLALPLERARVRRAGLRRVARSTITARRASGRSSWRRSRRATARRSSPTSRPRPTSCCGRATSTATRLIATGGSYGGYMVAYMNGHTNRYKAYVCHAGCYDWVSMMATDGYRFFAKELGAFHWDNEPRVMRQSPHHYVEARADADAGDPRRARLPRARDAGAAVLQHAEGQGRRRRGSSISPTRTTGS